MRGKPNPLLRIGDTDHGNRVGEELCALKDVSFQIEQGEVLGIIGRNGAGKSTLLKVLSRVTAPTSGSVKVKGRIASLLEVGTGFHPDLTGRENIYLNGAILGMTKNEIALRFDEIVDFSEVSKFIDTPVKRYSSGMYVRLAFAVAAHLESEILLIDEVLAVGDAEFQSKCLGKMGEVAKEGRSVIFVSHNLSSVQNLCETGLLLNQGKNSLRGNITECISAYVNGYINNFGSWEHNLEPRTKLKIVRVVLHLLGEQPLLRLNVNVTLTSYEEHKPSFLAIDISNSMGVPLMQAIPSLVPFIFFDSREHNCDVEIDLPPLIPGQYFVSVWTGSHNTETLDEIDKCTSFTVDVTPTVGRTFPHHADNGFIVPKAIIKYNGNNYEGFSN